MDIWEFMPYIEVYLVKLTVTSGLVAIFTEALKDYLLAKRATKGFVDGHMATFANLLGIKCPQCKKIEIWDPISITNKESDIEVIVGKHEERPAKKIDSDQTP